MGLIDGECIAVDGSIVKAHSNNFRLIKIEEIEFLQNLILDYGEIGVKIVFGIKIHKYFNENKKHNEINSLISEICNNLNKNALILLKTALISMDNLYYVLDLLDVLKANYDGKHTISLTDPESRWMMDKKRKYRFELQLSSCC